MGQESEVSLNTKAITTPGCLKLKPVSWVSHKGQPISSFRILEPETALRVTATPDTWLYPVRF